MSIAVKTFGEKNPAQKYGRRVCAYLVCQNDDGLIPVAKTPRGYFLLGGGVEQNEPHRACIRRECREEIGYDAKVRRLFCRSERYHWAARFSRNMHMTGFYYTGKLLDKLGEPTESNHVLEWLTPSECVEKLLLPNQAWAVKIYLELDDSMK